MMSKQTHLDRHRAGFSLIELMVVVAIIGIIAGYAYPSYLEHMNKTRRAEGKAILIDIMARQQRYYTENNSYTLTLDQLGYPVVGADNAVESENGYYAVTATACDDGNPPITCVLLTATAQGAQAAGGDGDLTLNSLNVKQRLVDGDVLPW